MNTLHRHPRAHPYELARAFEEGSEEHVSNTPIYKRHFILSKKEWLLEILGIFGALVCLVGIGVIFSRMHNKPLSAWSTRIPSLNTAVSMLTTASAALIMFSVSEFVGQYKWLYFKKKPRTLADLEKIDNVSRSALGSFKWLVSRSPNLASLGAIITILQLSFTPFAQQVILIKQRDIYTPANSASIGYTHSYNHLEMYGTPSGLANAAVEAYPQDPDMQSAIIQGLYGITPTEPFRCPGACSWKEKHISLGFKSECKNVTQATLKTAICNKVDAHLTCNMTTPSEITVISRRVDTDSATAYYMNVSAPVSSIKISGQLSNLPEITRFAIFRSTPDYNYLINDIEITECALSLAAYEYSIARANGSEISYTNRREVDFGVENPWQWPTDRLASIHTNETTNGDVHIPALDINYITFMALRNFFLSTTIVTEWVEGSYKNTNLGVSAALPRSVDLGKRFEKMATAMTDYLRYGPNSLSAYGDVIQNEAYVYIHWWYVSVPAATELLAILLAILTIVRNRKSRGVPLWKNSALAVLGCQLQKDEQYGILHSSGESVDQVKKQAKVTMVALP